MSEVFIRLDARRIKSIGGFRVRAPHPSDDPVLKLALREAMPPIWDKEAVSDSVSMKVVTLKIATVHPREYPYGYVWLLENTEFLEDFIKQYSDSGTLRI